MYPVIEIPFLGVALPSAETFVGIAVLLCLWVGPNWMQAIGGLHRWRCRWALVAIGLLVLAGGRAHFALNNWPLFAAHPSRALVPGLGALHAGGAIAALALGGPIVLYAFHLPIGRFLDALVPTVGLGIAVARIGCFLRGCCFGASCSLPWCFSYPAGSTVHALHASDGVIGPYAMVSAPVHPLPVYFALVGLLITAASLILARRRRYEGQIALVALWIFAATSAVLEFLRADYAPRAYWGPLPQLAWTAMALTAAATLALAIGGRRAGAGTSAIG